MNQAASSPLQVRILTREEAVAILAKAEAMAILCRERDPDERGRELAGKILAGLRQLRESRWGSHLERMPPLFRDTLKPSPSSLEEIWEHIQNLLARDKEPRP